MDLHILFGQRKEQYDGEHTPEALLCWTEYDIEENAEGWDIAVAATKETNAANMMAMRVVRVAVDGDKIRSLLVVPPRVEGAFYDACVKALEATRAETAIKYLEQIQEEDEMLRQSRLPDEAASDK